MARQSYFAEMRSSNNNPNFFNHMKMEDLRKVVKRIIKDIKYNNIAETDFYYFMNENVMNACIQESEAQYMAANATAAALLIYINDYLRVGYRPYKTFDAAEELRIASCEHVVQNTKARLWYAFWQTFRAIKYENAEIRTELCKIRTMPFDVNLL